MTHAQWKRVWDLYEEAHALTAVEADALLRRVSDGAEIIAEVRLILADAKANPLSADAPPRTEWPHAGKQVGRYQVEEPIGRGATAEVYAGRDTVLGRPVAMKFIRPECGDVESTTKSFFREAQAASALNHPNIVTVHEVAESGPDPVIVMELVEGVPLRNLCGGRPLPEARVARIGAQIALALAAAHSRGIAHRDLKPENVMVRPDGYVKVLDFGLARNFAASLDSANLSSHAGLPVGTLRYMSPEQCKGEAATPASDVFSLGLILYEMSAGRHPFEKLSPLDLAHAIVWDEPAPPSQAGLQTSPALSRLILQMLAKDPAGRPTSEDVAQRLETLYSPPSQSTRAQRSRWLPYAAAAVAMLGIAATVALRQRAPSPFPSLTSRPITSDPGIERDPDISPDGKYLIYAAGPDLNPNLMIRLIDGGEPRALTSSPNSDSSPVWSPDGTRIAFLRGDPANLASVMLISPLARDERKVVDVRPYTLRRTLMAGHLLAWMPDGRHLVVPDRSTDGNSGLYLVNVETGQKRRLTSSPPAEFDVEPSVSSDGRLLLFNRIRTERTSNVFAQSLGAAFQPAGPPRKLPAAGEWNGTPRLMKERREVLVCAGSLPRLALWRQPVDGSGTPISLGMLGDYSLQSAVHGNRIVVRTFRPQADILRFSLPAAPYPGSQEPRAQPFLASSYVERSAGYSPDGSRVAFISDRTGKRQLWVCSSSGENVTEWKQEFEADFPPPKWSPDGSRIVFTGTGANGRSQLFAADTVTHAAVPLTNDALDYAGATWSHDGKYLFAGAEENSAYGIYRLPGLGGAAAKILSGFRYVAGVEPTGKGIYVTDLKARAAAELYFVPLPSGSPVRLARLNYAENASVAPEGIYYLGPRPEKGPPTIALWFRSHSGAVKMIQEYTAPPGRGLSVSPDGRFALTTKATPAISDLLLLEPAR